LPRKGLCKGGKCQEGVAKKNLQKHGYLRTVIKTKTGKGGAKEIPSWGKRIGKKVAISEGLAASKEQGM